jgi:hypothetical protein
VIPPAAHPSAKASQSTVDAPTRRTGWGAALGGTATSCAAAPTSIPAACRLTAANWGGRAGWERLCGFLRGAIVAAIIIGETDRGSGGGSGGVAVLFQTGAGHGLSPLVSPRAPGTNRIHGHTAPLSLRPHTAHCLGVSIPQAAPQFLPVARPRSGITTLIRVRPPTCLVLLRRRPLYKWHKRNGTLAVLLALLPEPGLEKMNSSVSCLQRLPGNGTACAERRLGCTG